MNKKKIRLIIFAVIIMTTGIIIPTISKKELDFNKISKRFEQVAEEVLGEDIQPISKTELVKTLIYSHKTDTGATIYYRVLKTTYYKTSTYETAIELNTDALNVLFPVESMDTCKEMMIQNWPGALYKEADTAFLCWTYNPQITYVLEYTPSKTPDSEILKMAESILPTNE